MAVDCLGVAGRRQLTFFRVCVSVQERRVRFYPKTENYQAEIYPINTIKITGDYIIALEKEIIVESLKQGLTIRN